MSMFGSLPVLAQGPAAVAPAAATSNQVIIQRQALTLIEPAKYHVPVQLVPLKDVELSAVSDAIVRQISVKPGDHVESQTELVRFDTTERDILLAKAKAQHKVAEVQLKLAKKQNDADQVAIAEAVLAAAQADLDLAQHRLALASVRAPFKGEVFRIAPTVGQLVRAGEGILRFADTSQLKVEIPVDRKQAKAGDSISIRIEDKSVQAKIEHIFPAAPQFEPVRELVESIASAVVHIDNKDGAYKVGQSVHVPLLPRQPVALIANATLHNVDDGSRKIQIVRGGVVRDLTVSVLGAYGEDQAYVTGAFAAGDEIITSSSQPLADGTQIAPAAVAVAPTPPVRFDD